VAGLYLEDRGDGVLILVASEVPRSLLAERIPEGLAEALAEHNRAHGPSAWIRLRLAVHVGEVYQDEHGVVGTAVNLHQRPRQLPGVGGLPGGGGLPDNAAPARGRLSADRQAPGAGA
jgi:hypothetical protein